MTNRELAQWLTSAAGPEVGPFNRAEDDQRIQTIAERLAPTNPFYVECAVEHGGMAAYYLGKVVTADLLATPEWDLTHAVSEAREAWHYAQLLSDEQIESEIERQAREQVVEATFF